MSIEIKKLPAAVGMMSLVGVGGTPPFSWGNYFWIGEIRVANMWAENLQALVADGTLDDKMVLCKVYDGYCIVIDERVPPEYLYNKLCFTGGYSPTLEVLRDMYSILGDPGNEIEQYENPEKYWSDRGATYKNGLIIYNIKSEAREIPNITFTIEEKK